MQLIIGFTDDNYFHQEIEVTVSMVSGPRGLEYFVKADDYEAMGTGFSMELAVTDLRKTLNKHEDFGWL